MRTSTLPYASFTPRVTQLYLWLRGTILAGLIFQILTGRVESLGGYSPWYLAGAYALTVAIAIVIQRLRHARNTGLFWLSVVVDISTIAGVTFFAGGIAGNLYVFYFVMVAFIGYQLGVTTGLAVAAAITVAYAVPCFYLAGVVAVTDFIFRSSLFWVFAGGAGFASRAQAVATTRLLGVMDKLNERTTELERTHSQLQTIYETARSLAELLAEENVIDRVLTIARTVLNYPVCEIYTWDRVARKLYLKGRVDGQSSECYDNSRVIPLNDTFRRVIEGGEIVRVIDRHLGRRVIDGSENRSELIVPMISEGKLIGILSAGSPEVNAFGEREERVFTILAASSALALINADLHQQMEKLTIEDELTSLFNFRYFRTRLDDELRRAVRYSQPLSLIMVDIDWFKQINDRYGHEIGNTVLAQIAKVLTASIRDVDILARYGGEEFIIILPQTAGQETQVIGERIRRSVENTEFGPDQSGEAISLTVSVGISCYPENGKPERELVDTVDQALYKAKGSGKNAIRVATAVAS